MASHFRANRFTLLFLFLGLFASFAKKVSGYQVLISDQDDIRQVCSGMWGRGEQDAFIEVLFSPSSRGQLALVIFEWKDAKYLGVDPDGGQGENAWSEQRVYICTLDALTAKLCSEEDLGKFITTPSMSPTNTSIYTTSVQFDSLSSEGQTQAGPYRYEVKKTGYYCVGSVPLVLDNSNSTVDDASSSSSFTGVVDFENVFVGHLPASEYPKVQFYFTLSLIYLGLGVLWGTLCYKFRRDLLPIQNYVSGTVAFLVLEMFVIYSYYNYLNEYGHPGVSAVLLILVAVLNAARNSLSFFLLLITSMGYSVVRPSLGPVLLKIRLLALIHFVSGVLYALGTVAIPIEGAGFFIFFFVFPLAFSLTAFLMWIMWSLNSTIADLGARRQTYKKAMFTRLYRILVCAVIVIGAFFVISSLSFSNRLDENFGPDTWKTRWILLDGWLGVLYLLVFFSISFVWRPTAHNRRLALSDELPTDETGADEYDIDALTREDGDKDSVPLRDVSADGVVFDVGDDDDDDNDNDNDEDYEEANVGLGRNGRGENKPLNKTKRPTADQPYEINEEDEDTDEDTRGDLTRPPSYHKRD